MKRFTSIFAVGLAATLALSACGAKDAVSDAAGGAVDATSGAVNAAGEATGNVVAGAGDAVGGAAEGAAGGVMAMKDGVTNITTSIGSTVDAVKSGDFAAAQESFSGVETAWGNIKGLVPGENAGIEEKIAEVTTGLASDSPDSDSILSSLGGLKDLMGGLGQ